MDVTNCILKASGLTKSYKSKKAINGISLRVDKGECFALLGPNGAGKTTVCEILEGLREADQGEVEIFGLDLKTHKPKILQKIGVQLQETNLYGRFTVKETLNLFASFYDKTENVDHIIKLMQLEAKKDDILKNLSGGQKQRVYLGSSLINRPELLFLDEPTTGLDPQSRRKIWDMIEQIKMDGRSILLTTHYMDEAETLADRIAIQDHGQIIAEGSPGDLIREHIGDEIIELSIDDPDEKTSFYEILQDHTKFPGEKIMVIDNKIEIPTSDSSKDSVSLLELASTEGIRVQGISMRKGTLEDVFLKLTGRSIRDD